MPEDPDQPELEEMKRDLSAILHRADALPVLDHREPDEIVGYDENGIPK